MSGGVCHTIIVFHLLGQPSSTALCIADSKRASQDGLCQQGSLLARLGLRQHQLPSFAGIEML